MYNCKMNYEVSQITKEILVLKFTLTVKVTLTVKEVRVVRAQEDCQCFLKIQFLESRHSK